MSLLAAVLALAPAGPHAQGATGDEAAPTLALVGGTVHTLEPGATPAVATVLVAGERIVAVGPELEVPPGVQTLDVAGRHVVPGLVDAMVGYDPDHDALYLDAGVTLVRDIGSARVRNLALRADEARGATLAPALLTPGAPLDGDPPATPEAAILRDPSAAEALLPIVLSDQPDFLSVLQGLPADVHPLVCASAEQADLEVWGPRPHALTLAQALANGQHGYFFLDSLLPRGLDWAELPEARADELREALAGAGAAVVPAVEASALRLADPLALPGGNAMLALLSPAYEVWWRAEAEQRVPLLSPEVRERGRAQRARADAFLVGLFERGVGLVPGTGAPNPWLFPGRSLHAELGRWVEAGLPPAEVLALATREAAAAVGEGERRGVVAPGRVADLLVVAGDPRADLGVLAEPELVVLRGRAVPRAELEAGVQAVLAARTAEREALDAPLTVEPPPRTEGARVVLSGMVETHALGQRIGAERFAVERLEDGTLRYVGRLVEPERTGQPTRTMLVRQDVQDGRLVGFTVTASDGSDVLTVEGVWTAQSLRIRRLLNGISQEGVTTSRERVVTLDVGSVTSFLVLGRRPRTEDFPVLTFHEALVPEVVNWRLEIDPGGDFQVGTPLGALAFRLDERGAPVVSRRVVGRGTVDTRLLEADARGGPGHPLPADTARWVREAAAAAAARRATAPAEDDGTGDR